MLSPKILFFEEIPASLSPLTHIYFKQYRNLYLFQKDLPLMIKESKARCLNLRSCKNAPSHPTPPLNPLSHQLSIHFSIISLLLSQFLYFLQSITSINAVSPHLISTTEELQPIFFFFFFL